VIDGTSPLAEAQVLRQFVESEGTPLQFGISEGDIDKFFADRGFCAIANVTTAVCKEKYFQNVSCDRTVSPMFNFVCATVSG
jgi:O-methyltransferase involved in polyketide biosynthesis